MSKNLSNGIWSIIKNFRMLETFFKIYKILSCEQKKKLIVLQILVIVMALLEVMSIISIVPFVSSFDIDSDSKIFKKLFFLIDFFSIQPNEYLFFFGGIFVFVFFISSFFSIFTNYQLIMYCQKVGAQLSNDLFEYYLEQGWTFHTKNNKSSITNKIALESKRVSSIIHSFLNLNSQFVKSLIIVVTLLIFDFNVTIICILIFFIAYFFIYNFLQNKIFKNGKNISFQQGSRIKQIAESLGSIRDVLLSQNQKIFLKSFSNSSFSLARSFGLNRLFGTLPRYIIESIGFSGVIFFLVFLTIVKGFSLQQSLLLISIYCISGIKLLPAFQQIYSSLTAIKGSIPAFKSLENDLSNSKSLKNQNKTISSVKMDFLKNIKVKNLDFKYNTNSELILKNINIEIKRNSFVGIVGKTGVGKSTLIDLMIGFIKPTNGEIVVDDKIFLSKQNIKSWQKNISYVPQKVFLADESIYSNIIFGEEHAQYDLNKVNEILRICDLYNFVNELDDGLDTIVGENGILLSGGQMQRIGIARAIYKNKDILVLDESTNQLDFETENKILKNLKDLNKTIIFITHRLNTLKKVDNIIYLKDGKISMQGTFKYIFENNLDFKSFVELAN